MGKRKHQDSQEYIKKKIRKLKRRLRQYDSDSSYYDSADQRDWNDECPNYEEESPIDLDSEISSPRPNVRSAVHFAEIHNDAEEDIRLNTLTSPMTTDPCTSRVDQVPSTSNQKSTTETNINPENTTIPVDILEALGEPKGKQEVFGPKIQDEISKRWGRILCEGLNKDQKKELTERILVPENFSLVKAPKLNPEISTVVTEQTRNRDKRLEKAQSHLGLGISALTNIVSSLIDKDMDRMVLIRGLSEINQIFLDLHYENTLNRRKLITYTLDKKFLDIVQDVQRDSLLFSENLSEKIKASKSAEKSGLQIKKTPTPNIMTTRKPSSHQGNWRGSPRQAQRGNRRGGARSQPYRSTPKSVTSTDRYQGSSRARSRPQQKK